MAENTMTPEEEKQFIKAFNDGYLLSKHEPKLLNSILKSDNNNNEYIQGISEGAKQHKRETMRQELAAKREQPQAQKIKPGR